MPSDVIDHPRDVREGEALDVERVGAYLRDAIAGLQGEVTIQQFPSGFSNLTYLIGVGERKLVLRRPPFGKKARTAHDMGREVRMLRALKPYFRYCPEVLAYCEDPEVLGATFYVMERIEGIIPRTNFPRGVELTPEQARGLCERWIDVFCELHAIDHEAVGLGDYGRPEGYVRRQVDGWSKRFRDAHTADAPDFESVMAWLQDHMPADTDAPCVIHNDYKFDNIVLEPDDPLNIIGVLDWEMATIGDPLMDLGSSLAYWVEGDDPDEAQMIRTLPTTLPGMLSRDEVVARYAERSGRSFDSFDFYHVFGLFRLAVIAQQIYYRFYHGQTKDERFGMLVFAVTILEQSAQRVIERHG